MRSNIITISFIIWLIQLTGCASAPEIKEDRIGGSFRPDSISLVLEQMHTPVIQYHSQDELETMFKRNLVNLLREKKLFSNQGNVPGIVVKATYIRRFVGDETPFPTDSLAYPKYRYTIEVMNDDKIIKKTEKNNQAYSGGFTMNLKIIAGSLRDKKYEIQFIEALASGIVKEIEKL